MIYNPGWTSRMHLQAEGVYGFEVRESLVSDITDKLMSKIEEWQTRPLCEIYPIVFIDAIHVSVRSEGMVRKLEAYIVLRIDTEGKKMFGDVYRSVRK